MRDAASAEEVLGVSGRGRKAILTAAPREIGVVRLSPNLEVSRSEERRSNVI